jgi:protein-S-isoprenylcysteine O-methyltransferase Ste14
MPPMRGSKAAEEPGAPVTADLVSGIVGAGAATAIVLAGGLDLEVGLLAAISGITFAALARRARSEQPGHSDPTSFATALAFLAVLVAASFDAGREGGSRTDWIARGVGLTIIAAGLALRALAMRALGGSLGVRLQVRDDQALVHAGPYKWIRHPNYAGLILVASGIAVAFSSTLALVVAVCLWLPVLLFHIAREERMLIARFGRQYRAYMSRTWRLIVGIY